MKVSELMTREVSIAHPDETVQQAAMMMASLDAGAIPVGENDRLVGMITDRDIAIRAIGAGKGPDALVREVMTPDVAYCFEDEEVEAVAKEMGNVQVRRMPVINRDKRLVGIVSLGDVATMHDGPAASEALERISRTGGAHSQS